MELNYISSCRRVWSRKSWPWFPDSHAAQFSRFEHIMQKLHCMLMSETLIVKTIDVDNDRSMKSLERGVPRNNLISRFKWNWWFVQLGLVFPFIVIFNSLPNAIQGHCMIGLLHYVSGTFIHLICIFISFLLICQVRR